MTETKDSTDKTLHGGGARKPLSLQRTVESGSVRQNFSHGRSKTVVVEKRKTRKLTTPGQHEGETTAAPAPAAPVATHPQPRMPPPLRVRHRPPTPLDQKPPQPFLRTREVPLRIHRPQDVIGCR